MTTFSPTHLEVYNQETERHNYSDAWGLTCAQLGATLSELVRAQPIVAFTQDDLVGYHHLQYGMHEEIIEETLAIALSPDHHWRKWEGAQAFYETVPKVLAERTVPAIMERLVLGTPKSSSATVDTLSTGEFFEVRDERNAQGADILSLYPRNGYTLEYRGRLTRKMGQVTMQHLIGRISDSLKISTAAVTVSSPEEVHFLLVGTQEGHTDSGSVIHKLVVLK